MYKQPIPSLIPNEQKQIYGKKKEQTYKPPEQDPMINFQFRQPIPPKKKQPTDGTYFPVFPQNISYPPQFNGPYQVGQPGQQSYIPPIIRNIQINTDGGPTGNGHHERLFTVYEDSLPNSTIVGTMRTLGERKDLYYFVRSSIFNNADGKDILLSGKSFGNIHSILSFIKFSELNPFNTYKYSLNPYKGLPKGFLMYRSCYPIRYQQNSGFTQCAIDSTGVNVRIYKLIDGAYIMNRITPEKFYEFDEWREIAYYEYIRENIINKKICPHFVTLFGYFISSKSGIDFNKIDTLVDSTNKPTSTEPIYKEIEDEKKYDISYDSAEIVSTTDLKLKIQDKNKKIVELNPNAYTGKALVALTESPTYNLCGWASKTYQSKGNIKEMINRGTHTEEEWANVLFQILVSLYTMQIHKFFIKNFDIEKNVFVKDLSLRGSVSNYWKYKIDNIDYYIKNLGYLVLIDTNYKDVDQSNNISFSFENTEKNSHKIEGLCMGSNCKLSEDEINNEVFNMFINAFDPNFFGQTFSNTGGCKPPAEIMTLMNDIYSEATNDNDKKIKPYFSKYMKRFMNNRIGSYLKEGEVPYIRKADTPDLQSGNLVVYEDSFGTYKFVICLSVNSGTCKVLTKNDPADVDIITINVPVSSILNYSKAEPIAQTFRPNETNFSEENILETYVVR